MASLVVLVEIILLFFLSSVIKKKLFIAFYLLTKHQSTTISLISLLLYPGVVVHEFSHLIAAVILFVRVKSMTLVPKVIEGKIQGGSVVIEKVDVFRRTLVGIAPLFGGLLILWLLTRYLFPFGWAMVTSQIEGIDVQFMNSWESFIFVNPVIQIIIVFYLLFSISATMYSSQKDLEALLYSLPILVVGIIFLYIVGFQASWVIIALERFEALFINIVVVLALALLVQFGMYVLLLIYSTLIKPIRSG